MGNALKKLSLLVAALAVAAMGCFGLPGDNDNQNNNNNTVEPVKTPDLTGLSGTSLAVGDPLSFTGENFIDDDRANTVITFRGTYYRSDGGEEQVDLTIKPVVISPTQAVWERFGPYVVPFCAAGNQIGTFHGEIHATNVLKEGGQLEQEAPVTYQIQVLPSVIIRKFQPIMADCVVHSKVVLDHLPYTLEVEAVGFSPVSFEYTLSAGALMSTDASQNGSSDLTVINHSAAGAVDSLGQTEYFNFASVPYGVHGYNTSVRVDARAVGGETYSYLLPLTVRQPLVARYAGSVEVAQIYESVPVSGCMFGDQTGRDVQYTETHEEILEREYGVGFSAGWEQSYTQAHTATYGQGGSEANRIGFSTTDGVTFGWNVNTQVNGSVGFEGIAKVGFAVGMGVSAEESHSETVSGDHTVEANWNYNEALSQSYSASETVTREGHEILRVRSSESESLNFGVFLLPMKYGVFYRQSTRLVRTMEVVAYDLCGNWTVVGTMLVSDFTFAPDLAMGDNCPPFPESNLPEAQCLRAPCD